VDFLVRLYRYECSRVLWDDPLIEGKGPVYGHTLVEDYLILIEVLESCAWQVGLAVRLEMGRRV
jgi:hypothetical protein